MVAAFFLPRAVLHSVIARERSDRGNPYSFCSKDVDGTWIGERIATPVCELARNDREL